MNSTIEQSTEYFIDGVPRAFSIENSPAFRTGDDEFLSQEHTDIAYGQPWYDQGFTEEQFLDREEFNTLRSGLLDTIKRLVEQELSINADGLSLENYHTHVRTDADHMRIVSRSRDLFPADFNFPVTELLPRLEKLLGYKLTDINPKDNSKLHIIVRINRPGSKDYNPPHKDIYEGVDDESYVPKFINFWIPVAGVTPNSSLPLAPCSHRINENAIMRTFEGSLMEGNKYRVRMIKSWQGDTSLVRTTVKYGEVLIFSSHLIHGLATNDEQDMTRVALEFRLFKTD